MQSQRAEFMNLKTYNVEASFPSLDEARQMILEEIRKSRRKGVRVLKIIHGYGPSGKGGTLKHGLRTSFALRKKKGVIKGFIPGEGLQPCFGCEFQFKPMAVRVTDQQNIIGHPRFVTYV